MKRGNYEKVPQGVLDKLHELQQQLTAISDEKRKGEKKAMSTIRNLKEKMKGIEEEQMRLSDQIDFNQESLEGVIILLQIYHDKLIGTCVHVYTCSDEGHCCRGYWRVCL